MNTNLKTIALALVAGLTFAVCAVEPACEPKTDAPAPTAAPATVTDAEQAPEKKQAKPRRTRRAKKDKAAAPADGERKPARRRRTRKMEMSAIPVTGMLDSAE